MGPNIVKMYSRLLRPMRIVVLRATFVFIFSKESPSLQRIGIGRRGEIQGQPRPPSACTNFRIPRTVLQKSRTLQRIAVSLEDMYILVNPLLNEDR